MNTPGITQMVFQNTSLRVTRIDSDKHGAQINYFLLDSIARPAMITSESRL
jgi:hypothetical protein